MPGRKASPPRLVQRRDGAWVIKDRGLYKRTGCTGSDADTLERAARALERYLGAKHRPVIGQRDPAALPVADVLSFYEAARAPAEPAADDPAALTFAVRNALRRHGELVDRLARLNDFFGAMMVAAINAQACRDYAAWRCQTPSPRAAAFPPKRRRAVAAATARRELEDLRSAINSYHAEHGLPAVPKVTLPDKAPARERWLTRTEAARLVGAAIGFVWDDAAGAWQRDAAGRLKRRDAMTRNRRRHAARFILIGLYSGRREATIRRTVWTPSVTAPWFDLDRFIYHGRGRDERQTRKRRGPAAIAHRLRPHLKRWHALDARLAQRLGVPVAHVIHRSNGAPLRGKIKTAWSGILADAGLDADVLRHTLKHTAATWLMQSGVSPWSAAGMLDTTVEQLEKAYAHHHPDYQADAAQAIGRRPG